MPSLAFSLAAVLGFMAAGTSAQGFSVFCSVRGSILADNFLGMYCNNDNTVMYGYNWTWYVTKQMRPFSGGYSRLGIGFA